MTNEAIILAGGYGTRLRSVVHELPKSMAGINGRPFLEYLLDQFIKQGVDTFIMSVGYKHQDITGHFGNSYKNATITYAHEDDPLGTGGGIRKAMQYAKGEHVWVVNGDSLVECDLHSMHKQHLVQAADVTFTLKEMHQFDRYGTVVIDANHSITQFQEKSYRENGLINAGLYLFNRSRFTSIPFPEVFSIEKEYFESYLNQHSFQGFVTDGYFIDIGIPEDYQKAQHDFKTLGY